MSSLQQYAQNDDAFSRWLVTRPDLCPQAQADLDTMKLALSSSSVSLVCAGRDAADRVHRLARMANFVDSAEFYYAVYERYCLRLLALTGGK